MGFVDGANVSDGDIVQVSTWNNYLGTSGTLNSLETAAMTTNGDIIVGSGSKQVKRLGIGASGQSLQVNSGGTDVEYNHTANSTLTTKGDVLSASASAVLTRVAVGANDKVLSLNSGTSSGLEWIDAPGFTDPAEGESVSMQVQGLYADAWTKTSMVANRMYGAWLMPVWQDATITEIIYSELDYIGINMIASIYSSTDSTMTRVASTGSISVPSGSSNLTKVSLSVTLSAGTRYLIATSTNSTGDFVRVTPDSTEIQRVGSTFYHDPGSFTHPTSLAWSSVTKTDSDGVVCLLNNGGLIT